MKNKNEEANLKKRIKELEKEIQIKDFEKKQLQENLNKNEVMLDNILKHSTNVFFSHTANHEITYFSPQVFEVLGYKPEEAMMKWKELASDHPMNEEGYLKTIKAIETGKVQEPYELELIHKKGKKVYVRIHEAPVVENGKTIAIVGSLTDITDEIVSGTGLQESEEKFQLLFEKSQDFDCCFVAFNKIVTIY
jgi:PAS domain S-box-containing protein